jgi:hypothetical protein
MSEINRKRPIQCRAVHFKNQLLLAVMKQLAGNAAISFEGDLSSLDLLAMPGASADETPALKRNTVSPRQDFVILPLELDTIRPIIKAMGGTIPKSILHIQIAKADKLEFGAYDQFHLGALFVGEALGGDFLDVMVSEGILER